MRKCKVELYMVGNAQGEIVSSEYLYSYYSLKLSPAPHFKIEEELEVQAAVGEAIENKLTRSAHDVADGSLYIALPESTMPNELGFDGETDKNLRKDAYLFSESQSRIVVSVAPEKQAAFGQSPQNNGVNFTKLGNITAHDCYLEVELSGVLP